MTTVRASVPREIPVSVKIRLGYDDPSACFENARAAEEGGASWLTVHCRTKTDGYRPPAHWDWMPRLREHVRLPLITNGEIWSVEDFRRCREVAGGDWFMAGRGAIANPFLFREIRAHEARDAATAPSSPSWESTKRLLPGFFAACESHINGHFATARTKQWLKALSLREPAAKEVFGHIKALRIPNEFRGALESRL